MDEKILTVKEEIMAELFKSQRPLLVEEIARRTNRSRSAINSNMTELRKDKRVEYLGKEYGWKAAKTQPPGSIRGIGHVSFTKQLEADWPEQSDSSSQTNSEEDPTSTNASP